jgi:hypothetical protein
MSNSGKTVPVFVFVIAAFAVAALCWFALVRSGGRDGADSPRGDAAEETSARGSTASGKSQGGPETFTESDAHQLQTARRRLKEMDAETGRAEIHLQAARHAALKSNPELQKRLNEAQAIKRQVAAMVRALPKRKELDVKHRGDLTQMAKLRGEIQAIEKKVADGRLARERALAESKEPPVPEAEMRDMLTALRQLRKDEDNLRKAARSYFGEVKKLELQSREKHPEISAKASEAERIRREVSAEVSKISADVLGQHKALMEERDALAKQCSELGSRSNRVAMAERSVAGGPDS